MNALLIGYAVATSVDVGLGFSFNVSTFGPTEWDG